MERSGRPGRQLHHQRWWRAGNHPGRRPFGVHGKQCDPAVRTPDCPGVGCLWEWPHGTACRFWYLLLTDRRFQLPSEFSAALQRGSLVCERLAASDPADSSERGSPALVWPWCPGAVHYLRAPRNTAKCENTSGSGVAFHRRAAARSQYGPTLGICGVVRIPRSPQRGPEHYSRPDLREHLRLHGRRNAGHHDQHRAPRRAVYPRRKPAEPVLGCGLLLVHGGEQQLQRSAGGREPASYAGPGIQGKLHMVEESRHEFGADWRAGEQSGTNDSGPQRPTERLGAFGVERHKPGQHLLDLLTAFRTRQALVGRSEPNPGRTHRRMATRRNRDVVERFPLHSPDWLEPFRRWRHAKSRPAVPESGIQRTGRGGQPKPMVQPERVRLSGSPRVSDGGMTTTAKTIRINRVTNDAVAEGNVKSTYSDLKEQPSGALLASSSPIHVTAATMTAHNSPAVALYEGNARLWQDANIVEAPSIQFDRDRRSLVAQGTAAHPVSTVLVQEKLVQPNKTQPNKPQPGESQSKKAQPTGEHKTNTKSQEKFDQASPVTITSARLTYSDADRRAHYNGGVTARSTGFQVTADEMDAYLLPRSQSSSGQPLNGPGRLDRMVAEGHVVIQQPDRHADGQTLVYTASEDKFVLTGGPPSIFDAERGKITGVSLTFFRGDDRVLVEGEASTPVVTQTRVAK